MERKLYGCFSIVTALGGAVSFSIPYAPLALGIFLAYVLIEGLDVLIGRGYAIVNGVNDTPTLVRGIIRKAGVIILAALMGIIFWSMAHAIGDVSPMTTAFRVKFGLGVFPSFFLATFVIAGIQSILEHFVANSTKKNTNVEFWANLFGLLHRTIHKKTLQAVDKFTNIMAKDGDITSKDHATFRKLKKAIEDGERAKEKIHDLLK